MHMRKGRYLQHLLDEDSGLVVPVTVPGQCGQAMVEFAIVFPIQLFLTLALMQLAHLYLARLVVNHAAYLAARAALVTPEYPSDDWLDRAETEAHAAASMVCAPITGASPPKSGFTNQPKVIIPGWDMENNDELYRSDIAKDKTRVTIRRVRDSLGRLSIRADVEHDFEMLFLWDGNFLSLWLPQEEGDEDFTLALSDNYDSAHVTIHDFCVLPYMWDIGYPR